MLLEPGFFGTRAALYLDIVSAIVLLLPVLLYLSIREAKKGRVKNHIVSQLAIFAATVVTVIIFEVGVRFEGGFTKFLASSSVSEGFFIAFLILHIITALITINLWSYQIISSVKAYKRGLFSEEVKLRHKQIGFWLSLAILFTVIQGIAIYYLLFIA